MDTFQLNLASELNQELLSDISPEFLGFVLIEALQLTVNEFFRDNDIVVPVDDGVYRCDDPDSDYDNAVNHLLAVLTETDKTNGVLEEGEFHEYNTQHHEQICEKLNQGLMVIRNENGITELAAIRDLLSEDAYRNGYSFSVSFYPERAVFGIVPAAMH